MTHATTTARLRRASIACLVALRAAAAVSQEPGPGASGPPDTVALGRVQWAAQPAVGHDTALIYFERGGQRHLGMRYIESYSRTPTGLLLVQRTIAPDGTVVTLDSILLAGTELEPLWHSDVNRTGSMRVRFENGRMRGTSTDAAGVTSPVDVDMSGRFLDFSATASLYRLLPLRPGYSAVVQSYDIRRGVVHTPVSVVADEDLALGGRTIATWRVESRGPGGQVITHWIDRRTRRELQVRVNVGQADMVMERSP